MKNISMASLTVLFLLALFVPHHQKFFYLKHIEVSNKTKQEVLFMKSGTNFLIIFFLHSFGFLTSLLQEQRKIDSSHFLSVARFYYYYLRMHGVPEAIELQQLLFFENFYRLVIAGNIRHTGLKKKWIELLLFKK